MRHFPMIALAAGLAAVMALAIVPTGSATRASSSVNACSVINAAKAAKILGYPVRLSKGETVEDCNIVGKPIKIEDGRTFRPTIILEIDPIKPGLYKTVMAQAGGKNAKTAVVPGLGSRAFIVSIPALVGSYFVGAEVHGMLLQVSVGQA